LGVTTSLDMAYPDPGAESGRMDWRALLERALPFVDIFVPSVEEILYMLDRPLHDRLKAQGSLVEQTTPALLHDLSSQLLAMGPQIVMLKAGERGLYLRTAVAERLASLGRACPADVVARSDQELWAPCFKGRGAGPPGAGDAPIAGLLSGLLRGLLPRPAVTAAVAVGACNVEAADALGGLRSWEDTLARVAAGWERRPLEITAPGWAWDEQDQLWMYR